MNTINKYKIVIAFLACIIGIETLLLCRPLFVKPAKKMARPAAPAAIKGKIAIVLDDWGYHLDGVAVVSGIRYPLTASVLPGLSYSREAAEALHEHGVEIILHLPMEPREKLRLERDTIMTGMPEAEVRRIISADLEAVPYARGVSNHMGSRATEDVRTMEILLDELKQRHLFFLDSLVTANSAGLRLAKKMGIPVTRRDIFLDNNSDPQYIRQQLQRLKRRAAASGRAVGIGHDRRTTLEVLREEMPLMEKEGYRFVFASDLARSQ